MTGNDDRVGSEKKWSWLIVSYACTPRNSWRWSRKSRKVAVRIVDLWDEIKLE
jgi:hypothetical protein